MTSMPGRYRLVGLLGPALLGVALLTAGCTTTSHTAAPAPTPRPTSKSSTPRVDSKRIAPVNLPTPPALADAAGAVKDATLGSCPTGKGRQQVSGKVTNSTASATDYVIVVNWINSTYDVYGRGVATVKALEPGRTASWNIAVNLQRAAAQCTLNVQRGKVD